MRNVISLILNLIVVVIAVGCVIYGTIIEGEGPSFFYMYTRLSNVLAAVACALTVPYAVRAIRAPRGLSGGAGGMMSADGGGVSLGMPTDGGGDASLGMPTWLRVFKLAGAATVMVTFLTVFLFLGFLVGHLRLLQTTNFFFHLVSPLLVLVICIFERSSHGLPVRAIALPVALTAAYALWYLVEVVVIGQAAGGWRDFYGFNTGGMWPVSMVVMIAFSALVSLACWKVSRGGSARVATHQS